MVHSLQVSPLQDSPSVAYKIARFGSREVPQASRYSSGNVLAAKIDHLISSRASRNAFGDPEVLAAQVDRLISSRGPREVLQAFRDSSGNAPKFLAAKVDHLIRSKAPSNISGNATEAFAAKVDRLISCRGPAVFGKASSYTSENAPEVLAAKVDRLISGRGTAASAVFRKGHVLRPTQCNAVHCSLPYKPDRDTCGSQWVTNDMDHCGVLQYAQPTHQCRSQRLPQNTGSLVPPRAMKKAAVFQSRTHLPRKREELLKQFNTSKNNINYLPKPRAPAPPCFCRRAGLNRSIIIWEICVTGKMFIHLTTLNTGLPTIISRSPGAKGIILKSALVCMAGVARESHYSPKRTKVCLRAHGQARGLL